MRGAHKSWSPDCGIVAFYWSDGSFGFYPSSDWVGSVEPEPTG